MKNGKLISCGLVFFSLISCEKKNSNDYVSLDMDITVLNNEGDNLLSGSGIYNKNNINIYHIVNGQPQLYYDPNLKADKGFLLIDDGKGKNMIRVFANYIANEPSTLTLIKFGNSKMDTIKCEFSVEGSSLSTSKIWFNGELKSKQFTIIK